MPGEPQVGLVRAKEREVQLSEMKYHKHEDQNGEEYEHRHTDWDVPHLHESVLKGTIVNVGIATERSVGGRNKEVKSG